MRVVKSPFDEVDLGNTTYILGTELYQPGLASAGGGPKADYSPLYLGLRRGSNEKCAFLHTRLEFSHLSVSGPESLAYELSWAVL
jgi:hypothetical protein